MLTELERREIKAKLIELELWGADEPGDPAVNFQDALTLHMRASAKLAEGAIMATKSVTSDPPAYEVVILHGEHISPLATAGAYSEAVCMAALALPDFLRQRPECAAQSPERSEAQGVEESGAKEDAE